MRLSEIAAPFIVCVIYDDDVATAVRTVRAGERDGADAFELNLPRLGYPSPKSLAPIFDATERPIYTSCRRAPFTEVYGPCAHRPREMPEDERMAGQLDVLAQGSAGIDMELDTFDPHPAPPPRSAAIAEIVRRTGPPAEVTEEPTAVARQRAIVDRVHVQGREVVMSCHAARVLQPADAIRIGTLMVDRGADLVKIVGASRSAEDVLDLLQMNLAMRTAIPAPFTLMCVGEGARVGRFLGPLFGSSWAFGQAERRPGGFDPMPLVRDLRAAFDAIRPPALMTGATRA